MTKTETWQLELSELQFQRQVTDFATMNGWSWLHIERMGNDRGRWRTPVSGALGPGFPDLMLVRGSELIFAELKAQKQKPTGLQEYVLGVLTGIPFAMVYVWRPSDWELIMSILGKRMPQCDHDWHLSVVDGQLDYPWVCERCGLEATGKDATPR